MCLYVLKYVSVCLVSAFPSRLSLCYSSLTLPLSDIHNTHTNTHTHTHTHRARQAHQKSPSQTWAAWHTRLTGHVNSFSSSAKSATTLVPLTCFPLLPTPSPPTPALPPFLPPSLRHLSPSNLPVLFIPLKSSSPALCLQKKKMERHLGCVFVCVSVYIRDIREQRTVGCMCVCVCVHT